MRCPIKTSIFREGIHFVYGSEKVVALRRATVYAYDQTEVLALGRATVYALSYSMVRAFHRATIYAQNGSRVVAFQTARVYATDVAEAVLCGDAVGEADGRATLRLYGRAQAALYGYSTVDCRSADARVVIDLREWYMPESLRIASEAERSNSRGMRRRLRQSTAG